MPIENRNLQPGTKLVARYYKQQYTCEVVEGEGGKARYRLEDGREFKSLSSAGTAITGKACNGWVFWSLETDDVKTVPSSTEPETNATRKLFYRVPNQKGVPEGQTRWHCRECSQSFMAATGEMPETCPQGHHA